MSEPLAALMAFWSAAEGALLAQLFDSTRRLAAFVAANAALTCTAKSNPATTSETVPDPEARNTLMAIIEAIQFTPATPIALFPLAPIVPAACVPWEWSSIGSQVRATALKPCVPAAQV